MEPVKDNARTRGSVVQGSTTVAARPVTTLNTPAGTPARSASSASASAENGVSPDGCATTVQPAASAAAALRVSIAEGKFHGVISATTPTGSSQSSTSASGRGLVTPFDIGALGLFGVKLDKGRGIVDLAPCFRDRFALFPSP